MAVPHPPRPDARAIHQRRYLRPPVPLFFPEEEEMPETGVHLEVRTALYQLIQLEWGDRAKVGSEQFVYWDPTDPRKKLAPDVMVWVGAPNDELIRTWKVWERGAPHVGVEIISDSDVADLPWDIKLERYRHCGVREVVRFDPDDREQPLRLWDWIEGDLVERVLAGPESFSCDALGAYWCVARDPKIGPMLRLSRDPEGTDLFPTLLEKAEREAALRKQEAEARRHEAEARRREAADRERERKEEAAAREKAEQRIRELEAELAKRTPK